MIILTASVPSARLCSALSEAFHNFDVRAIATQEPPSHLLKKSKSRTEHLPCPIEPAIKQQICFTILDDSTVAEFLDKTFLNTKFVMAVLPSADHENDKLTLECLVTAGSAHSIAQQFLQHTPPHRLFKAAESVGHNKARRHLAEKILGVPDLPSVLHEYVENLLGGPQSNIPSKT